MMTPSLRAVCALAVLLGVASVCQAASPELRAITPRVGQRGTEVELTFSGERLDDAQEIVIHGTGLSAGALSSPDPKTVKATITIAPDAPLGEHVLRVRTASGVSELQTFHVTRFAVVAESEQQPQKVELNSTIGGVIKREDADRYVITATQGQRIGIEVVAMRLAGPFVDPVVTVTDAGGTEIASADDPALLGQDPALTFIAPSEGEYTIKVRDAQHGGRDDGHYLLHIGTFPRPMAIYPPGGPIGEALNLKAIGDASGPIEHTIALPNERQDAHPVWIDQNGEIPPSPNTIRVSPFPNVLETEPNNGREQATPAPAAAPLALNGILEAAGDHDWFRFEAKKDQVFDIAVQARRLGSPIDAVINIFEAEGKHLVGNDDAGQPDSALRWTAPADGAFVLRVRDQLDRGGPDFVYRVEITPVEPQVAMTVPYAGNNSQERQAIVIPRGNRFSTLVRLSRKDFDGAGTLKIEPLPPGVTAHVEPVGPGRDLVPVVFEAAADAPLGTGFAHVDLAPADANIPLRDAFQQTADYAIYRNNLQYYQVSVDEMAIGVVEEAPFKLSIVQPKVPIVQNGQMQLKITAERAEGFDKPIRIHMPFKPPGIGAGDVTIETGQTEALMPINAAGNAQTNTWSVCALGFADTDKGRVWVSSQLATLQVDAPYVGGKIEMAAAEQGQAVPVVCTLEQKTPFDGKARAELVGLPPNVTAEPVEVSAGDGQVIFTAQTSDKSPTGQHKSLFVRLTVDKEGEPIMHQFAHGGTIRIDTPRGNAPPPPPAPTEKPLSRLEQLRQQAAQAQ